MATSEQTTLQEVAEQVGDCPECHGRTHHDGVDRVCQRCGLVVDTDRVVVDQVEYRTFAEDTDTDPRHYAVVDRNRGDRGLGSEISRDRSGPAAGRLQKWHGRTRQGERKKDRNRDYATTEVRRVGVGVGLPRPAIERGERLFRSVHTATSLEGQDLDAIAAACLYAACREHHLGRVPDDLAAVARCDARQISRRVWWVARELDLEVPPPSVEARIRVVCGRLGVDHEVRRRARQRYEQVDHVGDTSPSAAAAWVVYAASECTQAAVAEAARVTPATIRNARAALSE